MTTEQRELEIMRLNGATPQDLKAKAAEYARRGQ